LSDFHRKVQEKTFWERHGWLSFITAMILLCIGTTLAFWVFDKKLLFEYLSLGWGWFYVAPAFIYLVLIALIQKILNIKKDWIMLLSIPVFSFIFTFILIKACRALE